MLLGNLISNFFGRAVVTLGTYLSTPFLIRIFGLDSFGIISLSLMLFIILTGLDYGITQAVNRYVSGSANNQVIRNQASKLISYLEIIYLSLFIIILINLDMISNAVIQNWLQLEANSGKNLYADAIFWLILGVSIRWYAGLYRSVLFGSERHILANKIDALSLVVAYFSPILINIYYPITLAIFFKIQAIVWAIYFLCYYKKSRDERFRLGIKFLNLSKGTHLPLDYGIKISAVAILTVGLGNIDKVFVSATLPLADFAVYSICAIFGSAVVLSVSPIATTLMPRISKFWLKNDIDAVKNYYLTFTHLAGLVILSSTAILIFNSAFILELWMGSESVKPASVYLASILTISGLFSGLGYTSNCIQVASGKLSITITLLASALFIFVISLPTTFNTWGLLGIGFTWLAINLFYFLISLIFTCLWILDDRDILIRITKNLMAILLLVTISISISYFLLNMIFYFSEISNPTPLSYLITSSLAVIAGLFFCQYRWLKSFMLEFKKQ
tara:strand:+ start:5166 stop:6677 length:1512 start_codon:yes stop_codon:yes gene_type:complete